MTPLKKTYAPITFLLTLMLVASCSQNETSFSEMPGFKQYFAENKPSESLPTIAEQALLNKFRPRIFMAKGQTPFIDFYADYISHGSLYVDGKLVSSRVTQELLNQYKTNTQAEFRYTPTQKSHEATVYGRIQRDQLAYKDQQLPLTFLSYNLVFANSGLLKGLPAWQRMTMGIVGSNTDWHQLDHYVGLSVALSGERPIAVMLQQHNYQTTWLLTDKTTDNTLQIPRDSRISVDVAMQSNELYPHSPEPKQHPGLSWVKGDSIAFLKTGQNKPMMAGWDMTHGEIEQEYTLKFLPTADAFYTFTGKLGEGRKLPGRDGPPGANYVTLPPLMPLSNRLVSSYRPRDLATEKAKIEALFGGGSFSVNSDGLSAYKRDFLEDLGAHNIITDD